MHRFTIIFVLLILVTSALACGSDVTPAPAVISSPTLAPPAEFTLAPVATEAPVAPAMAKLGETAEVAGMSLSATQVADPATPSIIYEPTAGTRLVAVEVIVGNVSSTDPVNVNPLNFTLVDADGFTYQAELGGAENQIDLADLVIGEKKKGWVSFEVPEGAVLTSIKFQPNMFDSSKVVQVGLTP